MTDVEKELADIGNDIYALPREKIERLSQLLDRASVAADAERVANLARRIIRARLRQDRPARAVTARRLFCMAFEDLLEDGVPGTKTLGRISRAAVPPIWRFLQAEGDAAVLDRFRADTDALAERGTFDGLDEDDALMIGTPVWQHAADLFGRQLQQAAARRDLRQTLIKKLGDPQLVFELTEMAQVLRIADVAFRFRRILAPKPVYDLTPDQADIIRAEAQAVAASGQGRAADVIVLAQARLGNPFDAMPVATDLGRIDSGVEGETVLSYLQEVVTQELGQLGGRFSAEAANDLTPDRVLRMGEEFTARLDQIRNAPAGADNARMRASLDEARASLRGMVEQTVIDGAAGEVLSALGDYTAAALPDPDDADHAERQRAAEARGRTLRQAMAVAESVGLRDRLQAEINQVSDGVDRSAEDIVKKGAAKNGNPDRARYALGASMRIMEAVAGSDVAFEKLVHYLGRLPG